MRESGFRAIGNLAQRLTAGVAKTNLPRNRYARRRAGMLFLE